MKQTKITLEEKEIPERWYNIVADMPNKPLPPLNPATQEPIGPEALAPLFPMALIQQEVSAERWIEIPDDAEEILDVGGAAPARDLDRGRQCSRRLHGGRHHGFQRRWPGSVRVAAM